MTREQVIPLIEQAEAEDPRITERIGNDREGFIDKMTQLFNSIGSEEIRAAQEIGDALIKNKAFADSLK